MSPDDSDDNFIADDPSHPAETIRRRRVPSLWRFEILPRGDDTHAADAIEIVGGDVVRRISMTAIDYSVVHQRNIWVTSQDDNIDESGNPKTEPAPADLALMCDLDEESVRAALRRLAVIGLLPPLRDKDSVQ